VTRKHFKRFHYKIKDVNPQINNKKSAIDLQPGTAVQNKSGTIIKPPNQKDLKGFLKYFVKFGINPY